MQDANVADRALSQSVVGLIVLLVITAISVPPVHAQVVGGTIQGTTTDASGALVARVKVSIVNLETNTSTTVLTNSSGIATAPIW